MSKDIYGYFHSYSKRSASSVAKNISNSDSEDSDEEPVTKKPRHSSSSTSSKKRHYLKKWETDFEWWRSKRCFP